MSAPLSGLHYLPKAPCANTITVSTRALTCELGWGWGDTNSVHSKQYSKCGENWCVWEVWGDPKLELHLTDILKRIPHRLQQQLSMSYRHTPSCNPLHISPSKCILFHMNYLFHFEKWWLQPTLFHNQCTEISQAVTRSKC